jgi:hypothetical protein
LNVKGCWTRPSGRARHHVPERLTVYRVSSVGFYPTQLSHAKLDKSLSSHDSCLDSASPRADAEE